MYIRTVRTFVCMNEQTLYVKGVPKRGDIFIVNFLNFSSLLDHEISHNQISMVIDDIYQK